MQRFPPRAYGKGYHDQEPLAGRNHHVVVLPLVVCDHRLREHLRPREEGDDGEDGQLEQSHELGAAVAGGERDALFVGSVFFCVCVTQGRAKSTKRC